MDAQPPPPDLGWLLAGPSITAALGVIWRHGDAWRRGKPFSLKRLAVELPSVACFGVIAGGLVAAAGLGLVPALAIAAIFGRLGGDFLIDVLLPRLLDRFLPKGKAK